LKSFDILSVELLSKINIGEWKAMRIDQNSLNDLLSMVHPQKTSDALREKREKILKNLQENDGSDKKELIAELQGTERQIEMEVFEENSRKLELERLEREEASAKNSRERERALAEHERTLNNASMGKLFSAIGKASGIRNIAGKYRLGTPTATDANGFQSLKERVEDINRDLNESVKFGIAAAEVARRRKNNQIKAENEEAAAKNAAIRKKKNKKSINVSL
jgi:hypothetical protein